MNVKRNPWVSLAALALLAVILAVICSGCGSVDATTADAVQETTRLEISYSDIVDGVILCIITDTETGAQYLMAGNSSGYGLTVLLPGAAEAEG